MSDNTDGVACGDGCLRAVFCSKCKQKVCIGGSEGCYNPGYYIAPEGAECIACYKGKCYSEGIALGH